MRRVLRPVVIAVLTIGIGRSAVANAQTATRIVYTKGAFGANITSSRLDIPDTSDHYLAQSFRIDRGQTDSPRFVIEQEHVWVQGETRGNARSYAGYAVYHMKGGDLVFLRWIADPKPAGTRADGEAAAFSGAITILGGTGSFARVNGTGIYRGYAKGAVLEENILTLTFP